MFYGAEFEATKQSYQSRFHGCLQLKPSDLAWVMRLKPWVTAVRDIAENLPIAVDVVE